MYYKRLKPIRDKLKYSDSLEKILSAELFHKIYKPLIDLLSPGTRENARYTILIQAFLERKIHYSEGYVYGTFNAAISKALRELGAEFNKTKKAFKLDVAKVPVDVKSAIAQGNLAESQSIEAMQKKAQELTAQEIVIPAVHGIADDTLDDLHAQFERLTPRDLEIPVEMNAEMEKEIRKNYTKNIHLEINKVSAEMTERLRYRVEQAVGQGMRAADLKEILMAEYGIASSRCKFVARQETSNFVAKYRQVRYETYGINEYQWSTSNDPRVRHDHRELNGRIFSFDSPPITDHVTGARNNPGEDFNCLPENSNIHLAYGIKKCFRRWYSGKLATLVTASGKTIRATPNHQVLTSRGWKAVGLLDDTDYLIDLSEQLVRKPANCIDNCVTSICQIFNSFSKLSPVLTGESNSQDFHGDGVNSNVYIVCTAGSLMVWLKPNFYEFLNNFLFSLANTFTFCKRLFSSFFYFCSFSHIFSSYMGISSNGLTFFKSGIFKSKDISFRTIPKINFGIFQSFSNKISRESSSNRNRQFTFSRSIGFNNWLKVFCIPIPRFSSFPSIGLNSSFSKTFNKCIRTKADDLGSFIAGQPGIKKLDHVVKVTIGDFSGHVFNLETLSNWFIGEGILYHNCRCVALPVYRDSKSGANLLETQEHRLLHK